MEVFNDEGLDASLGERQDRYNASLDEFNKVSESGELTEEKIRSLGLTPQVTDRLINTMNNARPEQSVSVSAEPIGRSSGGSFFDDSTQVDWEWLSAPVQRAVARSKEKVSQLAFAAKTVLEKAGEATEGVQEEIELELNTSGYSPMLDYAMNNVGAEDPVQAKLSDMNFLTFATMNPGEGVQQLAKVAADNALPSREAQLVAAAVAGFSPEQKALFNDTSFVTKAFLQQQAKDNLMSQAISDSAERLSWGAIWSVLNPLQAGSSRVDISKFQKALEQDLGIDSSGAVVIKANAGDNILSWLTDSSISAEEASERLEIFKNTMLQADQLANDGNVEAIWALEYLDIMQSKFRDPVSGTTYGAVIDALDTVDAATWADVAYRLSRIAVLKLTRPAMRGATWTAADIAQVNRLIAEATDGKTIQGSMPSQQVSLYRVDDGLPIIDRGTVSEMLVQSDPMTLGRILRESEGGVDQAVQSLGSTTDNLATRVVGSNTANNVGLHPAALTGQMPTPSQPLAVQFAEEASNLRLSDVLLDPEVKNIPETYAQILHAESRGTLYPSATSGRLLEDGTAEVNLMFGKNANEGYKTSKEAVEASNYLFDGNTTIMVRDPLGDLVPYGPQHSQLTDLEFFLQHKATVIPDRRFANFVGQETDVWGPSNIVANALTPLSSKVERQVFDLYSNRTSQANRLTSTLAKMLAPVRSLNAGKQKEQWARALLHGDANGVEFGSKAELAQFLGESTSKLSDKVWEAYAGTRDFYNSVARVRNDRVRELLSSQGFRSYNLNGNVLADADGPVWIKPFTSRPKIVDAPKNTDELSRIDGVFGSSIYDFRTGQVVSLTEDMLEQLYKQSDVMVARFNRPLEVGKDSHAFGIMRVSDQRALPSNPMNVHRGHVDVNYAGHGDLTDLFSTGKSAKVKGGNQYVVEALGTRTVNGVPMSYTKVVGIYKDKATASVAQSKMIDEAVTTSKITPEEAGKLFNVSESRERRASLDLNDAMSISNVPQHARKRGERIKGNEFNGTAELASLEDSLGRALRDSRNILGKDAIEVQKSRFNKKYGPYLKDYDAFPHRFQALKWNKADSEIISAARAEFNSIQAMDMMMNSRKYKSGLDAIEDWAKLNFEKKPTASLVVGASARAAGLTVDEATRLATTLWISARPFYQGPTNAFQAILSAVKSPFLFMSSTLPRTIISTIALTNPKAFSTDTLAKFFGASNLKFDMTGAQLEKFLNNMKTSGMFNIDVGDDLLSIVNHSNKIQAGQYDLLSRQFWGKAVNPLEWVHAAGKVTGVVGKAGITFNNFVTYNHAFSEVARAKGIDYALSRRGNLEVRGLAERMTLNQNRSDQFSYQMQREMSASFMFLQHVQKMFNSTILDPTLRTVTGGKVGIIKYGNNPWADSWAQAAMTTFNMTALMGLGGLATSTTLGIWDPINQGLDRKLVEAGVPEEAVDYFIQGVINKSAKDIVGEKFRVTERTMATNFVQTSLDLMLGNDGGLKVAGPVFALMKPGKEIFKIAEAFTKPAEFATDELMGYLQNVAIKSFAGLSDLQKAYFVYHMDTYNTKDGKPIANVYGDNWRAAVATAMSMQPDALGQYYENIKKLKSAEDDVRFTVNMATSAASASLQRLISDRGGYEGLTPDDVTQTLLDGVKLLDIVHQDSPGKHEESLRQFQNSWMRDPLGLWARTVDEVFKFYSTEESINALHRIKSTGQVPPEYIDLMIEVLEERNSNE